MFDLVIATQQVKSKYQELRRKALNSAMRKAEIYTTAFVAWAIELRPVQAAIARAFDGATPMCRVLDQAIDGKMDEIHNSFEVDADDVKHLDRWIADALEDFQRDFEIEADQIKGIDREIASAVEDAMDEYNEGLEVRISETLEKKAKLIAEEVTQQVIERIAAALTVKPEPRTDKEIASLLTGDVIEALGRGGYSDLQIILATFTGKVNDHGQHIFDIVFLNPDVEGGKDKGRVFLWRNAAGKIIGDF